jgi:uncharacterized protein
VSRSQWDELPGLQPPPGPMPDGSMPLYGNYPPPGAPGGEPPLPMVGWGPEFGAGGAQGPYFRHGGPQPKKRRIGLAAGLLLFGGLAVIVVVAIGLASREGQSPIVAPSPGATAPPPGIPTEDATDDRSGDPTVDPTVDATGGPSPTTTATPPPPSNSMIVTADPFYATGKQRSVSCRERRIALNSQANLRAYYTNLANCLNRAWAPQVRAGRDTFEAPRVVLWTGNVQSPCAGGASVSFYCSMSRTLYLKYDDDLKLWNRSADSASRAFSRMWATYTASHEFGHHLQQLTGILPAAHRLQYDAPDRSAALEVSRRIELQASCLGTVFMGANKTSYGITGLNLTIYRRYVEAQTGDENNGGGPPDHGRRASHQYWTARGFNSLNSASCNTFTASASKVS